MTKYKFLFTLRDRLSALPEEEVEEHLRFYAEMIEDRMEEGLSEDEAVAAVGRAEEIAAQILADAAPAPSTAAPAQAPARKPRLRFWEILLLVLGSPLWLSLLAAAFCVILSLYISLWTAVISLWAVFVSLAACALAGVLAGIVLLFRAQGIPGLVLMAGGLICMGLSVFLFRGCQGATRGTVRLTGWSLHRVLGLFHKKEAKG